ncbi:NfeD family protein [Ferviditalea candida]|uniref:NfeD family protein n=1 Tax=Ferviditalea candida TaxID=3108399 RepID=A0ABU5ZER1_9BACL|nr:NfeD family protein [Paenibacillaceae bacterium T2]
MSMWMIWFAAGVILIIAEMTTFTFYLLWLGIGAFIAALLAWLFPESIWLHILAASVAAILLAVFGKPFAKRFQTGKGFKDAVDELVGKHGEMLEPVAPGSMGIVRVGVETWSAISEEALDKGDKVIVVNRSSTVLHVLKWKGE